MITDLRRQHPPEVEDLTPALVAEPPNAIPCHLLPRGAAFEADHQLVQPSAQVRHETSRGALAVMRFGSYLFRPRFGQARERRREIAAQAGEESGSLLLLQRARLLRHVIGFETFDIP